MKAGSLTREKVRIVKVVCKIHIHGFYGILSCSLWPVEPRPKDIVKSVNVELVLLGVPAASNPHPLRCDRSCLVCLDMRSELACIVTARKPNVRRNS